MCVRMCVFACSFVRLLVCAPVCIVYLCARTRVCGVLHVCVCVGVGVCVCVCV